MIARRRILAGMRTATEQDTSRGRWQFADLMCLGNPTRQRGTKNITLSIIDSSVTRRLMNVPDQQTGNGFGLRHNVRNRSSVSVVDRAE